MVVEGHDDDSHVSRCSTRRDTRARTASLRIVGPRSCVGLWLVCELRHRPDAVRQLGLIVGLQNGALYALIALGYTMVYGIIELINFAHGDLFMLGTVFAGVHARRLARPDDVRRSAAGLRSSSR